jgi:hypothetical protein
MLLASSMSSGAAEVLGLVLGFDVSALLAVVALRAAVALPAAGGGTHLLVLLLAASSSTLS